jgi:Zn-dependent protease with chaperone function
MFTLVFLGLPLFAVDPAKDTTSTTAADAAYQARHALIVKKTFCDDPALKERLVGIVHQMNLSYPYELYVLNSDQLNAWTNSDGQVFVTTKLINFTENDDEVAGVIAHEYGHHSRGHFSSQSTSNQIASGILGGLDAIGASTGTINSTVKVLKTAIPIFSKGQEFEADTYAFEHLAQSGYDRDALAELFSRMAAYKGDTKGLSKLLSTHPAFKTRIDKLTEQQKLILPYEAVRKAYVSVKPDTFVAAINGDATQTVGYQQIVLSKKRNIFLFIQTANPVSVQKGKLVLPADTLEMVAVYLRPTPPRKKESWKNCSIEMMKLSAYVGDKTPDIVGPDIPVTAVAIRFFPKNLLPLGDSISFVNVQNIDGTFNTRDTIFAEKLKIDTAAVAAADDPGTKLEKVGGLTIQCPYFKEKL